MGIQMTGAQADGLFSQWAERYGVFAPVLMRGEGCFSDPELSVEVREEKNSYKKIVHKHGKIVGAILQGDLAYGGILQQLIAHKYCIFR